MFKHFKSERQVLHTGNLTTRIVSAFEFLCPLFGFFNLYLQFFNVDLPVSLVPPDTRDKYRDEGSGQKILFQT